MSNVNLAAWVGFGEDPRKAAFVKELTEKTKQGKVRWVALQNAVTATLPDGLKVNFVTSLSIVGGTYWQLFTLRDSRGNELIKASPSHLLPLPSAAPVPALPIPGGTELSLEQAISELFAVVNRSASDDLDRAISTIKNL